MRTTIVLLDLHSFGVPLGVDVVIGDVHGTTAGKWLVEAIEQAFREGGFTARRNEPFVGGWITKRFADDPTIHGVLIEVNQRVYLNGVGMNGLGQVVILNGVPRSGKSSIAHEIQGTFSGLWVNLGVDRYSHCLPAAYLPGVGLRPRDPRFDRAEPGRVPLGELEDWVPVLFAALYESIAAHARLGLNVVVDVGHHDMYSKPRGILEDCARRLSGLPVLFVRVLCPVDTVWERRESTWGQVRAEVGDGVRAAVDLWQEEIDLHGGYDLEVDTSKLKPNECAEAIRARLRQGPPGSRFEELARIQRRAP